MKKLLLTLCSLVLLGAFSLNAADLTGKWTGTVDFKDDGGEARTMPVFMILKQDGNRLTGSAGDKEEEQHPFQKGSVDGNNVTIDIEADDAVFHLELKVDGDQIAGDVRKGDGPKMKLSVKRVKET